MAAALVAPAIREDLSSGRGVVPPAEGLGYLVAQPVALR